MSHTGTYNPRTGQNHEEWVESTLLILGEPWIKVCDIKQKYKSGEVRDTRKLMLFTRGKITPTVFSSSEVQMMKLASKTSLTRNDLAGFGGIDLPTSSPIIIESLSLMGLTVGDRLADIGCAGGAWISAASTYTLQPAIGFETGN